MTLVSHEIPNLIGGVSQQPPAARFASQAEEQINVYPSVVDGLVKRQPTQHLAQLVAGDVGSKFLHTIFRDAEEKYVLVAGNGTLQAFGLDGAEVPIHAPGGGAPSLGYLDSTTPDDDYKALTVADFTFFVNTKKKVELDAALSRDYNDEHSTTSNAYVLVRQPAYNTVYRIYCNFNGGSFSAGEYYTQYTTPASGVVDTNNIVSTLVSTINGHTATWFPVAGGGAIAIPGVTAVADQAVIELVVAHTGPDSISELRNVRHTDGLGDTAMVSFYREVARYSELPVNCRDGEVFKVTGDANVNEDDYWIEFQAKSSEALFGDGHWIEAVAPAIQYKVDSATMPHQLVRKQDDALGTITGTPNAKYFEWDVVAWEDMVVGDAETNAPPSFVSDADNDRFIDGIFFHKNRLGFLSGEAVVLSGAGNFFNFWRTTVLQLLDDDPIDIGASHTKVALLKHALGFNERLVAFSDRTQFVIDGEPILTPKTASITPVTEFDNSQAAEPQATGRGIYFAYDRGDFSGLREMFQLGDSALFDAADVSSHVPQYIQGRITHIAASTLADVVAVITDNAPQTIYLYKYFWSGNEKVQSAWGKWTLSTDASIQNIDFVEDELFIVVQRSQGLVLEKIKIGDDLSDTDAPFVTHLDRRVNENQCTVAYNAALDESTITLPYNTASGETYSVVGRYTPTHTGGESFQVIGAVGNTLKVRGDVSNGKKPFWAGADYLMRYVFSQPVLRSRSARGNASSPVTTGRHQIRYGSLEFSDSRFFEVVVTPDGGRPARRSVFSPPIVGEGATQVDGMELPFGTFRFPVLSNSRSVEIAIENGSPWPCKLSSAEWEGQFVKKSRSFRG